MRKYNRKRKPKHCIKGKWKDDYFTSGSSKPWSIEVEFIFSGKETVLFDRYESVYLNNKD